MEEAVVAGVEVVVAGVEVVGAEIEDNFTKDNHNSME